MTTELLERVTTNIASVADTDRVVTVEDTLTLEAGEHTIYVTRDPDYARVPDATNQTGMVVEARRSVTGNGFIYTTGREEFARRIYGAKLNPALEHGHYYRIFSGRGGLVVQHIDEDHVDQRNRRYAEFNIISGRANEPWPIPNDSINLVPGIDYIEIEAPEGCQTFGTPDAQEAEQAAEPASVTTGGEDGPTLGLALTKEDGTVDVDPEVVIGETYVIWSDPDSDADDTPGRVVVGVAKIVGEHEAIFERMLVATRVDGELTTRPGTGTAYNHGMHWAVARWEKPEPVEAPELLSSLRLRFTNAVTAWESLNEAMNEIARGHDYCSEYEGIIEPLGFTGREDQEKDYDVDINVSLDWETSNTSGRMDEQLADEMGIGSFVASSMTVTGTADITMTRSGINGEAAEESIDSTDIEDWFRSNGVTVTVNDYDFTNTSEV